jgi:hypothetical protein
MKPFRFRAAGALDVRRRQEDEAREALAQAESLARAARMRADDADALVARECARLETVQHDVAPAYLIGWHRSWISKLRRDAEGCHRAAETAREAARRAEAAVREAHKRRRTLERWRDRALARYQREANAHETREMNALAGLRYVARAADEGEHSEHDQRRGFHDHDGPDGTGHAEEERHQRPRAGRVHEPARHAAPAPGSHAAPGR